MKIKKLLPIVLFFAGYFAHAQTDTVANAILDRFAAKAMNAPSVSLNFKLITNDLAARTTDTLTASIILSKDSYKLEMPNNIIWFDGTTSWSYLIAEDEVVIINPDKNDISFQSKPSGIFSMHKNGYKASLVEENASIWIIDLYPEDTKSDLIKVRLSIGKNLNDLKNVEYRRKDGIVIYILVNEYNLNVRPEQNLFVFDKDKYKGVEIIDMR